MFKEVANVVVAQMDAGANDLDPAVFGESPSLPIILRFPANDKENPVKYTGPFGLVAAPEPAEGEDRAPDVPADAAIIDFLTDNLTLPAEKEIKEGEKAAAVFDKSSALEEAAAWYKLQAYGKARFMDKPEEWTELQAQMATVPGLRTAIMYTAGWSPTVHLSSSLMKTAAEVEKLDEFIDFVIVDDRSPSNALSDASVSTFPSIKLFKGNAVSQTIAGLCAEGELMDACLELLKYDETKPEEDPPPPQKSGKGVAKKEEKGKKGGKKK
jgi:hypothetical protein